LDGIAGPSFINIRKLKNAAEQNFIFQIHITLGSEAAMKIRMVDSPVLTKNDEHESFNAKTLR
jgi:hypothetical protein